MPITTNEKKIELIEELLTDKYINFKEALMLLETEKEYIYYPQYPYYNPFKVEWQPFMQNTDFSNPPATLTTTHSEKEIYTFNN